MKPRRHLYLYLSSRVTELFAANHRGRHRLNPHPLRGGIRVGAPEGFDPGRTDA